MKTAFVTGITGQDGYYLSNFLLSKNYEVYGVDKNNGLNNSFASKVKFVQIDIADSVEFYNTLKAIPKLDEFYNLAAVSSIPDAIKRPFYSGKINALAPQMMMECLTELHPNSHFFQASSSAMFGRTKTSSCDENIPFAPDNPYAIAKLYAHNMAKYYRNSCNLFVACGILFNHESPRRGLGFVTQKVTYAAACAKLKIKTSEHLNEEGEPIVEKGKVKLGSLEAKRDWGFAGDYVEAMWQMLQTNKPDDFVIGTGKVYSIKELCDEAFSYVGLDYQKYVEVDPRFIRPTDNPLVADISKAKEVLGWQPRVGFGELVKMLVDANLNRLK